MKDSRLFTVLMCSASFIAFTIKSARSRLGISLSKAAITASWYASLSYACGSLGKPALLWTAIGLKAKASPVNKNAQTNNNTTDDLDNKKNDDGWYIGVVKKNIKINGFMKILLGLWETNSLSRVDNPQTLIDLCLSYKTTNVSCDYLNILWNIFDMF